MRLALARWRGAQFADNGEDHRSKYHGHGVVFNGVETGKDTNVTQQQYAIMQCLMVVAVKGSMAIASKRSS